MLGEEVTRKELNSLLEKKELEKVINFQNTATQLIDNQSQELKKLRKNHLIDDFRHMELQQVLNDFYTHQEVSAAASIRFDEFCLRFPFHHPAAVRNDSRIHGIEP